MPFQPKETKKKVKSVYKTLYLSEALLKRVEQIAKDNGTSVNNVIVSMIEHCLEEDD